MRGVLQGRPFVGRRSNPHLVIVGRGQQGRPLVGLVAQAGGKSRRIAVRRRQPAARACAIGDHISPRLLSRTDAPVSHTFAHRRSYRGRRNNPPPVAIGVLGGELHHRQFTRTTGPNPERSNLRRSQRHPLAMGGRGVGHAQVAAGPSGPRQQITVLSHVNLGTLELENGVPVEQGLHRETEPAVPGQRPVQLGHRQDRDGGGHGPVRPGIGHARPKR